MIDKENLKYPVKYAIMPIKEQIDLIHGLDESKPVYGVVANIVAKCYVISEKRNYYSDGTTENKYEVAFLYKNYSNYYDKSSPSIIKFKVWGQCLKYFMVNQLFNSFEEAQIIASKANDEILSHKLNALHFTEDFPSKFAEIKSEHEKTIAKYQEIANTINEETRQIEITKTSPLEDLIKKIVENPQQFYIDLAQSLSFKERDYLKQLIKNKCCENCTNESCKVETCEKIGLNEFGEAQGTNCINWNNYELIGRQRILSKNIL